MKGAVFLSIFAIPFLSFLADAQTSDKLFMKVDPSHSNIQFDNELRDTREANIMIYSNYYGGAGVGIGDINDDGLQDIFFAGNLVPDRLYLNKGNMVFEDITNSAGIEDNGGWSSGVLFGDINGDDLIDIYVTRELYDDSPELRRNKLYINNGDLTFTESAERYGLDNDQRTRHATFIDYDKDGDLDLFLLNQPPNPGDFSTFDRSDLMKEEYSPRLMENQGDVFVDVTKKAGLLAPCFPNSVTASDLNNDGWTDLFIANDFWIRDFIYINNGDGTFTDKAFEMTRHISFSSMGVDAGDINNDGYLDVIVLDMVAEDNFRRKSNMSGMPQKAFENVVKQKGHHQYMYNMLHLNREGEFFSDIAQFSGVGATDWSWSVLLADFDNDGWKDIHIANGLMRDIRDNDAAREFQKYIENEVYQYIQENPNAGDVTLWDVVDIEKTMNISPSVKLQNYAYRNKGNLQFEKVNSKWGLDETCFSNGSAYADLDNDGDLDLVISNINDLAFVYENQLDSKSDQHYLRIKPIADEANVTELNVKVTIQSEGQIQYFEVTSVRGMYSTSEYIAHFGLGEKKKVDEVKVEWPDGKVNLLKNQKADRLIEVYYSDASIPKSEEKTSEQALFVNSTEEIGLVIKHNENTFNDFERQLMLPHKFSDRGPCYAIGDVNGDGLEDIFMGASANGEGRLFSQMSDGSFGVLPFPDLKLDKKSEDIDALFLDVDGDDDLDLYVVSGGNEYRSGAREYQDRLYTNDGKGLLSKSDQGVPKSTISGSRVVAADYDDDGDLDLFIAGKHDPWSYPKPVSSILLKNESGVFKDVTAKDAKCLIDVGMVHDATWMDYNNDGRMDLALAGEWMPLTIIENTGDGFINAKIDIGPVNYVGWWFSVESADMDNDGDVDFILGNIGLNYPYKASPNQPFHAFYDDFDNNGIGDLVLAQHEGENLYPVRERNRSVKQLPLLEEKFKTFNEFAGADVYDIYGKENLERSLHYRASQFESVYVENIGNGKFKYHSLPFEAQLFAINEISIDDYNKDGFKDALLAGNMYGSEAETVRSDAGAGLLLLGDGQGAFGPVEMRRSGIRLPYDVKRMKSLQYKGINTIVVGCNNDYYQFLQINENSEMLSKDQSYR